jgi:hypothetical protein
VYYFPLTGFQTASISLTTSLKGKKIPGSVEPGIIAAIYVVVHVDKPSL